MTNEQTHDKIALLRLAFKGLEDQELQEMAALTEFCAYPAGHVLCHEGEYEDFFYIIAEGNVAITKKIGDDEKERVLRESGKGDLVGEMALIQNVPRAANVRTTTDCVVLEMGKKDFETILSRSPRMAMDIIRITLDRMRANDQTAIAELQKNNKILRHLDRNKLEFIQVAAHELRTPLTVVKGYIDVLNSLPGISDNKTLASVIEGIAKGAERMHEVVNLMLDITRVDAEVIKIATVPVPLHSIIDSLARDLAKAATERQIEINIHYDEHTPTIHADPSLLPKALYHLMVNAIKYTPNNGKVFITTRPVMLENQVPGVEVAIRDTGIGVDADHQELIFEKFYQVGSVALHSSGKTSFRGGGSGLGLAFVRGVARAHDGKVWVESEGHDEIRCPGSTFYFQLPINPPGTASNTKTS